MKYYNLIFAVFYLWRLAMTTLDKQILFFIVIYNIYDSGMTCVMF